MVLVILIVIVRSETLKWGHLVQLGILLEEYLAAIEHCLVHLPQSIMHVGLSLELNHSKKQQAN